jgi:uncharacterized protein
LFISRGVFSSPGSFLLVTPAEHRQIAPRFNRWRLRVARSPIHRFGIFATIGIPRGRKVIEYTGERITMKEALRRLEKIHRFRRRGARVYLFHLTSRRVIDGAVGGSGAEWINHSCDPNLRARKIGNRIFYFSRRQIHSGEELTIDYRFPEDSVRVVCRCGSPACRGTINALK